jgi:4-hydroxyphenylpyruvate dioxygenase
LAFVQVSDLAGVARELAVDADRILPGDGDFRLREVLQFIRRMGYEGWVSLELMNPTLWNAKPVQVAEVGLAAMQRLLDF